MATILEFKQYEQRLDEERPAEAKVSGEIIIFPGVRRERHSETDEVEEAPKQRKRERAKPKRDRIELPD